MIEPQAEADVEGINDRNVEGRAEGRAEPNTVIDPGEIAEGDPEGSPEPDPEGSPEPWQGPFE